jgi:hypothetical protein
MSGGSMAELNITVYRRVGEWDLFERWSITDQQPFDGTTGLRPTYRVLLERRRDPGGKVVGERRHGEDWEVPWLR